jgi:hypothetical protein
VTLVKSSSTADASKTGLGICGLGKDQIRYFLYLNGRWRWRPTKAMKAHGFGLGTMGTGGPANDADGHPVASIADQQRAIELNRKDREGCFNQRAPSHHQGLAVVVGQNERHGRVLRRPD